MLRTPLCAMALLVGATVGAARARADPVYVSSNLGNLGSAAAITRIDTVTGQQTPLVMTLPGGNAGTEPLVLDPSGNLYVGVQPSSGLPFIEKYTPAGVGSLYATLLTGTLSPSRLAFDSSGNLYTEHSRRPDDPEDRPGRDVRHLRHGRGVEPPVHCHPAVVTGSRRAGVADAAGSGPVWPRRPGLTAASGRAGLTPQSGRRTGRSSRPGCPRC